jgi:hypothetical protein
MHLPTGGAAVAQGSIGRKNLSKKPACALLALFAAVLPPAQADRRIADEYEKSIKSAEVVGTLGNDMFGDQVNLYTGALTFTATDISLPGNSSLPVALSRKFVVESRGEADRINLSERQGGFWDWDLDIPHLQGTFGHGYGWQVDGTTEAYRNARCTGAIEPPTVEGTVTTSGGTSIWGPSQYWHGNSLSLPGGGSHQLLGAISTNTAYRPSTGGPYPWVTSNMWVFSCLTSTAAGNGVPGEGFLGTAPDGTRYWFDWIVSRGTSTVTRPFDNGGGGIGLRANQRGVTTTFAPVNETSILPREEVWILPTRAEDRHGNWVTYTYSTTHPWRLTRILANDGREITITHNAAGRIATATAGTRTWTYTYSANGLSQVALPDGSAWNISFGNLLQALTAPDTTSGTTQVCDYRASSTSQIARTGAITHPSGATGEFTVLSTLHGRSYVQRLCPSWIQWDDINPPVTHDHAFYPKFFDVISLTNKRISGPGLTTAEWTYVYGPANASWTTQCSSGCMTTKTVTVTGPGDFNRYTFGNRYENNEGKLLKVEAGSSSSSILKVEDSTYALDPTGYPYPPEIGLSGDYRGDSSALRHTPLLSRQVVQQGRTFSWQVPATCGGGSEPCFDVYARPTTSVKSSAP